MQRFLCFPSWIVRFIRKVNISLAVAWCQTRPPSTVLCKSSSSVSLMSTFTRGSGYAQSVKKSDYVIWRSQSHVIFFLSSFLLTLMNYKLGAFCQIVEICYNIPRKYVSNSLIKTFFDNMCIKLLNWFSHFSVFHLFRK